VPETITQTVYSFDELSPSAKDRALSWYRELVDTDDISDSVYSDAEEIAQLLGIEFKQRAVKLMSGETRYEPCIWWSGFGSQGDGACFEGSYAYNLGSVAAIKAYAPQDAELHRIASELAAIQRRNFYRSTATIRHRGHYYHEYCTAIEVESVHTLEDEKAIAETLRSFMRWIYRQLEAENDYQTSEENVAEMITANEYRFYEDGRYCN
jgi:hypothetical protein